MAQIVDTPKRRAFMAKLGRAWAGSASRGRRSGAARTAKASTSTSSTRRSRGAAARRSARASASSARRSSAHGSEKLKQEFLPKILTHEVEFAVGLQRARRRFRRRVDEVQGDAVTATAGVLNGQKTWTTSAHFAEWYWVGARTDPERQAPRHHAVPRAARPPRHHDQRHLDDGRRAHQRRLLRRRVRARRLRRRRGQPAASSTSRRRSTSSASRCSRSRRSSNASTCCATTCATETVDGEPLKDDPVVRQQIAQLVTQGEVRARARAARRRRVDEGRCTAHDRVVGVQALSRPSSRSGWRTRRWTSAGPGRSCGCTPRKRP